MRAHIPLIGTVWGAAIILLFLEGRASLLALLMGVAMVLAGSAEMRKVKRRRIAHDLRRQASYGVAVASVPPRPVVYAPEDEPAAGEATDETPAARGFDSDC